MRSRIPKHSARIAASDAASWVGVSPVTCGATHIVWTNCEPMVRITPKECIE